MRRVRQLQERKIGDLAEDQFKDLQRCHDEQPGQKAVDSQRFKDVKDDIRVDDGVEQQITADLDKGHKNSGGQEHTAVARLFHLIDAGQGTHEKDQKVGHAIPEHQSA